jgi:hypothetical protein
MKCGAWKSLMRQADRVLICDPGSYFVTRVALGSSRKWRPCPRSSVLFGPMAAYGSASSPRQLPRATAQQMAQTGPDRSMLLPQQLTGA